MPRNLTFDEARTWGPCPQCHAKHGTSCRHVTRPGATHWMRYRRAPNRVSWLQYQKARVIAAINRALETGQGARA